MEHAYPLDEVSNICKPFELAKFHFDLTISRDIDLRETRYLTPSGLRLSDTSYLMSRLRPGPCQSVITSSTFLSLTGVLSHHIESNAANESTFPGLKTLQSVQRQS